MNLILFGFKGCGKTHFGKLLSKALKRPFLDTDNLLAELYDHKLSPREIHCILGETAFRALETKAILQLDAHLNAIIALGGGAVLEPTNLAHLQKIGQLVYLRASFETIKKRILQGNLPAFVDAKNPEESLYKIYQKRIPMYEAIQAKWVDVDLRDEAEIIASLINILQSRESSHGL
jgi:shikimate kinase